MTRLGLIGALLLAIGLAMLVFVTIQQAAGPKDGEFPLPAEYKSWPKFLSAVQRPDAKQVRELYVNPTGATATAGQPFPNGTLFVMENYTAKEKPDGSLETGPSGTLIKGDLVKIFLMIKSAGWGQEVPDNLKTGSWVYSAYGPDGKPLAEDFTKCRGCHLPLAQKDFVHRYDEYFATQPHHQH